MYRVLYRLSTFACVYALSFFLSYTLAASNPARDEAHRKAIKLWGPQAADVPQDTRTLAEELLYQLDIASSIQQYEAARYAIFILQKQQGSLNKLIADSKKQNKLVSLAKWHEWFAREVQLKHLKKCAHDLANTLSFGSKITVRLGIKKSPSTLGDLLARYYEKEISDVVSDYQRALNFFAAQRFAPLPLLLQAWNDTRDQQRILDEAKQSNPILTVQIASFLVDIGMQIALTSGENYTEKIFSEDDQKIYKSLMDEQTALQNNFQSFQANLAQKTTDSITQQSKVFLDKFKEINEQRGTAQKYLAQEINYLMRSINNTVPKDRYLTAPITYDQYFGASVMSLPPGIPTWYNIFQTSWLFDKKTMSFFQQYSIPFSSPYEAAQNSIFTEYITNKSSYTIETEITLIDATYPFFAGLIFNKARWLSGSEERLQQYRLAGIYGTSQKSIVLTFAQTALTILPNGSPQINPPFNQIADNSRQVLYTFPQTDSDNLGKNPLTFILRVETSSTSITITLFKKNGTEVAQLVSTQVTPSDAVQNRALFWYHGVGFMSPGCQARFKIVKPVEIMQGRAA